MLKQHFKNFNENLNLVWLVKWFHNGKFIGISVVDCLAHQRDYHNSIIIEFIDEQNLQRRKNGI